ncbi:MAG: phosphotransferase [Planctomycetota bacterium]
MLNPYVVILSPFADFLEVFGRCLRYRCNDEWDVKLLNRSDGVAGLPVDVYETMVLAFVELRMKTPGDKNDETGLRVADAIKRKYGVPVILMGCEMPQNGLVDHCKRAGRIDEFLLIRLRYDGRWRHVDQVLKKHIQVNKHLETPYDDCPDEWSNMVKKVRQPNRPDTEAQSLSAADLAHLFHRLFPVDIQRVDFEEVPKGFGDAATARARVFHRGYPTEETLVIKWGEKSIICAEQKRVKQYVEQLGPRGVASIRWSAQMKGCAAAAYWSVQPHFGGQPRFLADYLGDPEVNYQKKRDVIESVFTAVFAPWYDAFMKRRKSRPIDELMDAEREQTRYGDEHNPGSLIHHCVAHLWGHRNLSEAIGKIQSLSPENPERDPDPVKVIGTALKVSNTGIDWLCPQHGDLHPRNIFVVDEEPWIIDFGDVHLGHPMKDLATLETALRFTVFYCYEEKYQHRIVDAEARFADFDGAWKSIKELKLLPFASKRRTTEDSDWPDFIVDSFWCTHVIRTLVEEFFCDLDSWQEHYSLMLMLSLLKIAGISRINDNEAPADEQRKAQAYRAASLHAKRCEQLLIGSHPTAPRRYSSSVTETAEEDV